MSGKPKKPAAEKARREAANLIRRLNRVPIPRSQAPMEPNPLPAPVPSGPTHIPSPPTPLLPNHPTERRPFRPARPPAGPEPAPRPERSYGLVGSGPNVPPDFPHPRSSTKRAPRYSEYRGPVGSDWRSGRGMGLSQPQATPEGASGPRPASGTPRSHSAPPPLMSLTPFAKPPLRTTLPHPTPQTSATLPLIPPKTPPNLKPKASSSRKRVPTLIHPPSEPPLKKPLPRPPAASGRPSPGLSAGTSVEVGSAPTTPHTSSPVPVPPPPPTPGDRHLRALGDRAAVRQRNQASQTPSWSYRSTFRKPRRTGPATTSGPRISRRGPHETTGKQNVDCQTERVLSDATLWPEYIRKLEGRDANQFPRIWRRELASRPTEGQGGGASSTESYPVDMDSFMRQLEEELQESWN